MVELLVAMSLLSLIVLALMAVFTSTQRAFRAGVTQTDILEGGRAAMDLISRDLSTMTPSDASSNVIYNNGAVDIYWATNGVNFFVGTNFFEYYPLWQKLPGATGNAQRENELEYFFVLGRENTKWTGAGYIVNAGASSPQPLYPLYRFYQETNISYNPSVLYTNFLSAVYYAQSYNIWTNLSHVMDGVVHLRVRAYDPQGYLITNTERFSYSSVAGWTTNFNCNVECVPSLPGGEAGMTFLSNAVPAAVELELGVLEDHALQRANSLGIPNSGDYPASSLNGPQWQFLQNQSGHVYVFHQRVTIPSLDSSAYQ